MTDADPCAVVETIAHLLFAHAKPGDTYDDALKLAQWICHGDAGNPWAYEDIIALTEGRK